MTNMDNQRDPRVVSEKAAQLIFNGTNVSIVILDEQCRMKFINAASIRMFMEENEDPKNYVDFDYLKFIKIAHKRKMYDLQTLKKIEAIIKKILAGSTQNHRVEFLAPNGKWYASHIRPIMKEKLSGFMITHDDITDQKLWEQTLIKEKNDSLEQSKRKTFFLANLSHELKTPLNSILGFSDLLKEQLSDIEQTKGFLPILENIRSGASHLHSIILRILEMAKIQSGNLILKEELASPQELIDLVINIIKPVSENRAIEVTLDLDVNKFYLKCDKNLTMEVLINLITNSLKYSDPKKPIKIRCGLDADNNLNFYVEDYGIGMNEAEVKIALEPFGQNLRTPNDRYMGLGLGLPFSVQVVELHGGSLQINSKKGQGTKIQVLFPVNRVTIK